MTEQAYADPFSLEQSIEELVQAFVKSGYSADQAQFLADKMFGGNK